MGRSMAGWWHTGLDLMLQFLANSNQVWFVFLDICHCTVVYVTVQWSIFVEFFFQFLGPKPFCEWFQWGLQYNFFSIQFFLLKSKLRDRAHKFSNENKREKKKKLKF